METGYRIPPPPLASFLNSMQRDKVLLWTCDNAARRAALPLRQYLCWSLRRGITCLSAPAPPASPSSTSILKACPFMCCSLIVPGPQGPGPVLSSRCPHSPSTLQLSGDWGALLQGLFLWGGRTQAWSLIPKSAQAVGTTGAAAVYLSSRCGKLAMRSFHIPAQLTGILWDYFDIARSCALPACSVSFSGQKQSLLHRQRTFDQAFTLYFSLPSPYISLFLILKKHLNSFPLERKLICVKRKKL